MSSLFESVEIQDKSSDARALESMSPRSLFLCLIALVFVLGFDIALALYALVRLHHFAWSILISLPVLGFGVFRWTRIIYRRLER